jgi:hypothetical protein
MVHFTDGGLACATWSAPIPSNQLKGSQLPRLSQSKEVQMPLALMKHREVLPLWQYHIDDKEPRTATHDSMGFPLFYCTRLRPLVEREATLVEIYRRTAEMASHGWCNPDENVSWERWKKQRFVWNTEDKFSLESPLAFCTDEPVLGADTTIRRFVTCADLILRWTDKIYAEFRAKDQSREQ